MTDYIDVTDKLPDIEGYYEVMFADGTTDEKPFRIRPNKKIYGFMTDKEVIRWREVDWEHNHEY